jgi:Flp pilus assembly protein TadG
MLKRRLRGDSGSAFVELALTLPLLTLILIASAELGRIAYAAIEVTDAARAAVAYGSQSHDDAGDWQGMEYAASNAAPNIGDLTFTQGPTSTAAPPSFGCVCETITGGTASDSPSTPGSCTSSTITNCNVDTATQTQTIVAYVQAYTQANVHTMFTYQIHGWGLPTSFLLSGSAQMRVVQ